MSEKASHWWPYLLVVALSAILLLWRCNLPVAPAVSPTPTAGPVVTVTPLRAEVVGSPTATPPSTATAAVATATAFVTPEPTATPHRPAAPAQGKPVYFDTESDAIAAHGDEHGDEVLNLTDEAHEPIRAFIPANELDLQDERGDHEDRPAGGLKPTTSSTTRPCSRCSAIRRP
jgi:hypothetical protein